MLHMSPHFGDREWNASSHQSNCTRRFKLQVPPFELKRASDTGTWTQNWNALFPLPSHLDPPDVEPVPVRSRPNSCARTSPARRVRTNYTVSPDLAVRYHDVRGSDRTMRLRFSITQLHFWCPAI
ncbi:hypothetical protein BD779DRAFT_512329 [Infundibulicybe gibba]|nr:hypothetical protein BD779DRAFT_512329 [Infundibulicybe gibba]